MNPKLFHSSSRQIFAIKPNVERRAGKCRRLVFAQPSEVVAHAYALKNPAAFTCSGGEEWCFTVITSEKGLNWESALHKTDKGMGGFIYEIDARKFKRHNAKEWVSKYRTLAIPYKTRFVTIEDAMKVGVQIFIIENTDKYATKDKRWRTDPLGILKRGSIDKGIRCLNQETGNNPIPIPPRWRPQRNPLPKKLRR